MILPTMSVYALDAMKRATADAPHRIQHSESHKPGALLLVYQIEGVERMVFRVVRCEPGGSAGSFDLYLIPEPARPLEAGTEEIGRVRADAYILGHVHLGETTAGRTAGERVAEADAEAARHLGDYNEHAAAGRKKAAEKSLAASQRWLDRSNDLRGNGSIRPPMKRKTHKRYSDREDRPDLRALALCNNINGPICEDAYLTSKDEEVTCGRCRRIAGLPVGKGK